MRPIHRRGLLTSLALCLGILPVLASAGGDDANWLSASARRVFGANQGVYVETVDGTVLVAQAESVPVHPASVSKVPTTLTLLHKYGGDHRFVTSFLADAPVRDGALEGDLTVSADGDPFFVDENALLVAHALQSAGIRRVTGTLRAQGTLYFDWDVDADGSRLQQALAGHVSASAWDAVRALISPAIESPPVVRFDSIWRQSPASNGPASRLLLRHLSQPLLSMAKALNDYSNNIFKSFADAAGGASGVEAYAKSVLPASMRTEITLGDGAGTDPANRMSPRVAVRLLRQLDADLQATGHSLADILPVAGVDPGTLQKRIDGPDEAGRVVGKTGTFGDYGASALVGAISTTDRGTVYFAILNHDIPVPEARRRQERFVRSMLSRLHTRRWPYTADPRPAVARARVERGE